MKTSKIILITFLGIIGLFLLSLVIQKKPIPLYEISANKHIAIPSLSHIVINARIKVTIDRNKEHDPQIAFSYNKNETPDTLFYKIEGDTLIIQQSKNKGEFYGFLIYCKSLKSVTINQSEMNLRLGSFSDEIPELVVNSSGGKITVNGMNSEQSLSFNLNNKSELFYDGIPLKLANVSLDNSKAHFNVDQINTLNASLLNSSQLVAVKILSAQVQCDSTSRYTTSSKIKQRSF